MTPRSIQDLQDEAQVSRIDSLSRHPSTIICVTHSLALADLRSHRVGKTTTAEAVALSNQKPLFTITSGDLGFTPRDVETSLQQTFRLAQLWDCVLLLDEADLFLSRREVEDLERNSLVSGMSNDQKYHGFTSLTNNHSVSAGPGILQWRPVPDD